jgi:AcrR family transcriptional regulator
VRQLVQAIIEPPHDALPSMSIHVVAERAGLSTRTVYRVLEGNKPTLPLDTADRLLLAIDKHLDDVRLVQEDDDCG